MIVRSINYRHTGVHTHTLWPIVGYGNGKIINMYNSKNICDTLAPNTHWKKNDKHKHTLHNNNKKHPSTVRRERLIATHLFSHTSGGVDEVRLAPNPPLVFSPVGY